MANQPDVTGNSAASAIRLPALRADGVSCERGGRRLFLDLTFEVKPGEVLALVGMNGSGKSSLLRILAGLLVPTTGSITYGDGDETLASAAHYLGHADASKSALTVLENTRFWARYYRGSVDPMVALEAVDLADLHNLPASVLSAGQRRRLSLARLLVARRPVWLMDEPTSTLDRESEATLGQIMSSHVEKGGLIVAATHLDLPVKTSATITLGEVAP